MFKGKNGFPDNIIIDALWKLTKAGDPKRIYPAAPLGIDVITPREEI